MGIRSRITRWLDVEGPLRAHIAELQTDLGNQQRIVAEQTARIDKLEKRLGMVMGAVQASTAQLMGVKQTADEARTEAQKASQRAASALAAAEAATDGVAALEG